MALSRVTGAFGSLAASSIGFAAGYAVGDAIFIVAANRSGSTPPTLPAGWTSVGSVGFTSIAMNIGVKIAASTSETSGTWTNATDIAYVIYSGAASTPFSNVSGQQGTSTSISYSGIVSYGNPSNDWVIAFAFAGSNTGNLTAVPPTSTSIVTGNSGAAFELAIFDSNGPLSSYSFNSKTLGASVTWVTRTVELVMATSATPTNLFFQALT